MPNELNNEAVAPEVGYYEHRYDADGSDPKFRLERTPKPKAQIVFNVVRKMNEHLYNVN